MGTTWSTRVASPRSWAVRTASERCAGAGLGVILDIVPNHMAADDQNR